MNRTNYPTRYSQQNEWSPFLNLRHEVDRLFDDFWGNGETTQVAQQSWSPPCEVVEDKEHYLVTLEVAGIPKDDIRIEVLNHQLIISGERKSEERRSDKGLMYSERRFGKFQRSFNLPTGLNTDKIEADYDSGVLRVLIPKAETARPRQVKISSGAQTGFFSKLIGKDKSAEDATTGTPN